MPHHHLPVFSLGFLSGLMFLLLGCSTDAQRTTEPLPPAQALAAPRVLPAVEAHNLLSFMVLWGGTGVRLPMVKTGDHMPSVWRNDLRQPLTIYTVACKTAEGTADVLPVLEPGGPQSILTHPCPCRPGTWTLCGVGGFPVVHAYSADGTTCPVAPCELGVLVPKADDAKGLRVSITGPVAP